MFLTFLAAVDDVFTAGTLLELLLAAAFHLAFTTSFGVRGHGIKPSSGVAV